MDALIPPIDVVIPFTYREEALKEAPILCISTPFETFLIWGKLTFQYLNQTPDLLRMLSFSYYVSRVLHFSLGLAAHGSSQNKVILVLACTHALSRALLSMNEGRYPTYMQRWCVLTKSKVYAVSITASAIQSLQGKLYIRTATSDYACQC